MDEHECDNCGEMVDHICRWCWCCDTCCESFARWLASEESS